MGNYIYKVSLFVDTKEHREERGIPVDEKNSVVFFTADREEAYKKFEDVSSRMADWFMPIVSATRECVDAFLEDGGKVVTVNMVGVDAETGKTHWFSQGLPWTFKGTECKQVPVASAFEEAWHRTTSEGTNGRWHRGVDKKGKVYEMFYEFRECGYSLLHSWIDGVYQRRTADEAWSDEQIYRILNLKVD